MPAVNITMENFEAEVIKSDKPALLEFWADWCGPCRIVSPVIDEIADESGDKKICKINVDEQPELAGAFNIKNIPSFAVIKDGRVVNISSGVKPKDKIIQMFEG